MRHIKKWINDILTAKNANTLNQDSRLWANSAPIKMLEDMMALKGYIKTAAIYPENGVFPYIRCIDSSSSYISELSTITNSRRYKDALEKRGATTWDYVARNSIMSAIIELP